MLWVLFVLVAWAAAAISCARLCVAALEAARLSPEGAGRKRELSLYEAAFLSGGPHRVAELTLVSMHRRRMLLLAHTGWATVVDPEGEDDLERSVIGAIGPAGQARIAPVRAAASAADAVRAIADRLVSAGLAVPDGTRSGVAAAVRGVQGASALTVAMAGAALLMLPQGQAATAPVLGWFALPLLLTLGCLAIARIEVHPYTRWASPDGQRLLGTLSPTSSKDTLTALAVGGVRALDDPRLRAALTNGRMAHRSH
ncbi:TIGR04222 domain-containing membrane protein [Streptomyces sp. NPDC005408]|uniref:TIGR04222 domain-containing membrane protein n=1 Tax=Streptomyces sp. NPDC005408 TaxID=3155341 RepID=UPI0033B1DD4A